jgi:hypothetical protein
LKKWTRYGTRPSARNDLDAGELSRAAQYASQRISTTGQHRAAALDNF